VPMWDIPDQRIVISDNQEAYHSWESGTSRSSTRHAE
jgi:hypothetical protein